MMTTMTMLISLITPIMNHPMMLGMMVISQTVISSIIMFKMSTYSWFSYIIFITMVGGLMVMFIYMASIASNEKFKPTNLKKTIYMLFFMSMLMKMNLFDYTMENVLNIEFPKMNTDQFEEIKFTSKFYNSEKKNLTILLLMILMITMISVTNIASTFEGPLKKTYVQIIT